MGRGAAGAHEIYPGRPDLDRRHRGLVSARAKIFLRRNPGLRSFTASDLVPDSDHLGEAELAERVTSIAKGLVQLEDMGVVAVVGDADRDPAYALTKVGSSGMGGDKVAGVLR